MKQNIKINLRRFFYAFLLFVFSINIQAQTSKEAIVYVDRPEQIIRGFGASNAIPWRPDMTTEEIKKAFGTKEGQIGFSILRLRIPYLKNDFKINLPTAKLAHSMGVMLMASSWSPPLEMKTNNDSVGGRLKKDMYEDYAVHLKSFVDYMTDNGAPVKAVSIQNEPDIDVTYESCYWNAEEMVKFFKEKASSIGVDIIAPESYNFNKAVSDAILNDKEAAANLSIVGGHLYDTIVEPYPLSKEKSKELWMTEHLDLDTSWVANLGTGIEINECMNAGMNAYIWWYIKRFYGPINEKGNISKRGFVMSQFARFIRPGYYKLENTFNPQQDVYVTAYIDSATSKVVIIAINTNSSPLKQIFKIPNGNYTGFVPYTTSAFKNCLRGKNINTNDESFTIVLEPSSITTFVLN